VGERVPRVVVAKAPKAWITSSRGIRSGRSRADLKLYARLSQKTLARRGPRGVPLAGVSRGALPRAKLHPRDHRGLQRRRIHLDYVRYPNPDAGYIRSRWVRGSHRRGPGRLGEAAGGLERAWAREVAALKAEWYASGGPGDELVREVAMDIRGMRPE